MSPRVEHVSAGDLVYQYRANNRLIRGDIGIAIEVIEGREQYDEAHVKVRFIDGIEEIKDARRIYYAGMPVARKGKVIVKWLEGCPDGTLLHQEWPTEMVTELGFALATDPWGDLHWLPPRSSNGDWRYGFRDSESDHPRSVAMQTLC